MSNCQIGLAEEIDGDIVMSNGANPGLGLSDLSFRYAFGCGRPSLAKCDWFCDVADAMDQLGDGEWNSEDNLPADFVVANDPPLKRENPEDNCGGG